MIYIFGDGGGGDNNGGSDDDDDDDDVDGSDRSGERQ